MNLLKIHNRQPSYFLNSHTASLSPPRFLSLPCFRPTPSLPPFSSLSLHKYKFPISRVSGTKPSRWTNEEKEEEFEDLAPNSVVYQKTLRLVECSMFAAVAGLAYFLSNSLAIENYFGCFFSLPIVLSSMRWGVAAGRKTMVATTMLLFVLSGPVKASTYLVRAMGAMGYVLISSFLIRENILALITLNVHASITYMFTAIGVNTIPSMDLIYALFGTLLLLNSGFFVFLLHILYAVFLSRLGMKASLTMPRWLEKAI